MKEFDLKAALNGEPVMLRNERKAFVVYDLRNYTFLMDKLGKKALNGVVFSEDESVSAVIEWDEFGASALVQYDIIGMWEEPKISIEDLPKPFKPKNGEPFYYINGGCIEYKREYRYSNLFDKYAAENGNCFRTREGAEMWLKLMKGMME